MRQLPIGVDDFKKLREESGLDRSDIILLSPSYEGIAVILELKVADLITDPESLSEKARKQVEEKKYDAELSLDGYHTFFLYGIAFYKKICKVTV